MTYENIDLIISGIGVITSSVIAIVLGIVSYRLTKKQIETDQKIADMQETISEKERNIDIYSKRENCFKNLFLLTRMLRTLRILFKNWDKYDSDYIIIDALDKNVIKFNDVFINTFSLTNVYKNIKIDDFELFCDLITQIEREIGNVYSSLICISDPPDYNIEDIIEKINELEKLCAIFSEKMKEELRLFDY